AAKGSAAPPPPQPARRVVAARTTAESSELREYLTETTIGLSSYDKRAKPARNQYVIRNF
ncbi:MAG TPA: hypothetical protein PLK42_00870, partial [Casimicrobium sp.]|nr:hypothetical protein [Casimicrobium sp.]